MHRPTGHMATSIKNVPAGPATVQDSWGGVWSKPLKPSATLDSSMLKTMFTVHHTGRCLPPFTGQRLGLPHELAHCVIPGWSQLVNIALLSLMRRVWVYVALPCSRINLSAPIVGRPDRMTREAGRLGLMGRDGVRGNTERRCTGVINTVRPKVGVSL